MTWLYWVALLSVLAAPAATDSGPGALVASPVEEDLIGVKRNLEREQQLLENLKKESTSVLQVISKTDQEINGAESRYREALQLLANLNQEIAEHNRERGDAATSLEVARARLRLRLRTLYKMGELGWMNLLFGGEYVEDVLLRFRLLKRLARLDRTLMEDLGRIRDQLELADRVLGEKKRSIEGVTSEAEHERQSAAEARFAKLKALEMIRQQEAVHRKTMQELEHARERLLQVVATIEGGGAKGSGFRTWQGRLPAPVDSGQIDVPFGRRVDPRFRTVTINQGVDIRAKPGTAVKAIYPGQVAFADIFQGYGLLVILDHGGGYFSLYAHLQRFQVAKGDKVTQGQPVGTVGDTGSLKGPCLYFEIREGGKAADPEKWVRF